MKTVHFNNGLKDSVQKLLDKSIESLRGEPVLQYIKVHDNDQEGD